MSMVVGDAETPSGLAGRLRTELVAQFGAAYVYDQNSRKALNAFAKAIIDEIQANAEATGTGDYIATRLEDSTSADVTADGSPTTDVTIPAGSIS